MTVSSTRVFIGLAALVFLGVAVGITLYRQHALPDFDTDQFSRNIAFRISDERAPAGIAGGAVEEPCAGSRCYAHQIMGWAQPLAACASGVRIGVISTSVDARHPALAGAIFSQNDFSPHNTRRPSHWHGTALLALLAGKPSGGVGGLIPGATFFMANAAFADSKGEAVSDVVTLLKALSWMSAQNLQVVLLDMSGPRDPLVDAAISSLVKAGTVVIVPAGPDGNTLSSHPDVIAVAAVNQKMTASKAASRSSRIDLVAPGIDIWTALPGHKYGYVSSNSFAAAYVTAVLATVPSPSTGLSASDVKERALALVPVKKLGEGFGRGLALATKDCAPRTSVVSPQPSGSWMSTIPAK